MWLVGCIVGLLAAMAASSGSATTDKLSTVSAPLLGTWTKTMTNKTWRKHGVTYENPGHWGITILNDGRLNLLEPPGQPPDILTHMSAMTVGPSLVVGPTADGFCVQKVGYTWKVTGSTLVIAGGAKDNCVPRRVLFTVGKWTKE